MPEGDTIFRLRRALDQTATGHVIADGELRSGASAGARLTGIGILEFDTHGKHLLARLDSGHTLHTHLRMQGAWLISEAGRMLPRTKHHLVRARIHLDNDVTLWGVDLPIVELLRTTDEWRVVGHLGPDPLRADWDARDAAERLRAHPERSFATALLDQRAIAGLGNLWVNELAFLMRTNPFGPIGNLDTEVVASTAAEWLQRSATGAIAYQSTTGRHRAARNWVYARAGQPCLRCGERIRVQDAARTRHSSDSLRRTFWCPRCQPDAP